jgi:hypothetical protein
MVLSAWLVFECKTVLAAFILIWLPIFCECGLQTAYVLHEMVQQGQHDSVESILKDKTAHIDTKNHCKKTAVVNVCHLCTLMPVCIFCRRLHGTSFSGR